MPSITRNVSKRLLSDLHESAVVRHEAMERMRIVEDKLNRLQQSARDRRVEIADRRVRERRQRGSL